MDRIVIDEVLLEDGLFDENGSVEGVKKADQEKVLSELDLRMERLMETAPSDASGSLVIRKSADGYRGLLKIRSSREKFVAGSNGRRLAELLDNVFEQIRAQLDEWHGRRFASP